MKKCTSINSSGIAVKECRAQTARCAGALWRLVCNTTPTAEATNSKQATYKSIQATNFLRNLYSKYLIWCLSNSNKHMNRKWEKKIILIF